MVAVAKKSKEDFCNAQDLVRAVGVSNYGPRQLERINDYLTERGVPLASAQVCRPPWSPNHGETTLQGHANCYPLHGILEGFLLPAHASSRVRRRHAFRVSALCKLCSE